MHLSPGTSLGPYEILSPLGAGGMGEVWKARDTRLDRIVAIKRLTAHSERFEQEARAIAALNHPHICQIHDIGADYLVLEYVEGAPLRGPLPAHDALRLAIHIASALEAAHAKGILHRDLKPANVMVTSTGAAKLLDFGLAKLVGSDADVTRTTAGTVLGTAAYMSPEQARGQSLDARSDVFSFGAVLYEMLSGTRAFDGPTTAQVTSAILRDDPAPLKTPPALEQIVRRCLEKTPARRFQTMADVRAALEQISIKPTDTQPSIAVLPFADMSAGKDHEWFSDGLSEEIINVLAHLPGLKVTARTSAFAFRGKDQDVRQIAEALGVRTILEGSVRHAGSRIRVTAQLINAEDGYHLWSERYDREMADVFAIQDEISQAIAVALQVTLSATPEAPRRHTPKLPAYEALLKARYHLQKMTPDTLARSRRCYEEAIALDPGLAQAHAELGVSLFLHATENLMPAREAAALMSAQAGHALAIDPSLPDVHAALALAAVLDYNWPAAQTCFERAMACTPILPHVRYYYAAFFLTSLGRMQEVAEELGRALQEDPLNILFRSGLGWSEFVAGNDPAGEAAMRQVLELSEDFWIAYLWLCALSVRRDRLADALAFAEKMYALVPAHPFAIGLLAGLLSRSGDANRPEQLLTKFGDGSAYGAPSGRVCYHMVRSELDLAAEWFKKTIAQRDTRAPWIVPHLFGDRLISSPHWPALARLMHLPATS